MIMRPLLKKVRRAIWLIFLALFLFLIPFPYSGLLAPPDVRAQTLSREKRYRIIQEIIRQAREQRLKMKRARSRKKMRRLIAAFLLAGGQSIDPDPCMEQSGVNPLYLTPPYFPAFVLDYHPYSTVIIGDSTAAANAMVPGWMNREQTQSVAVPGNRLCHYIITFRKSIRTPVPQTVIVSTLGGNDLLVGLSPARILTLASRLRSLLRERFPEAHLIGVGIHPSLDRRANKLRTALNDGLRRIWENDEHGCFVDPESVFGVGPGAPARPDQMLPGDKIHYNEKMTLALHQRIVQKCRRKF